MKKKVFFEKFWNFRILKIFLKKVEFSKKKLRFLSYEQTKKTATRFFHKLYIHKKKNLARAHAKSHFVLKTQKSSKFGPEGRIFYGRARGSARAPKLFYHRIFHKFLHLPDTLDVFISFKLIAVDAFEVGARRCTCEHHRVK